MLIRSVLAGCAIATLAATAAAAGAEGPARCEETSFRIYFAHDSAALDPTALQAMELAERNVAGCSYAALRVMVDTSSPYVSRRAAAIRTAAEGRTWNAVRVERRPATQRASNSPEFAEIVMTPNPLPPAPDTSGDVGV